MRDARGHGSGLFLVKVQLEIVVLGTVIPGLFGNEDAK